MNSRHMKRVLYDTARGAIGQANINAKELCAFAVPVPPLALQAEFARAVEVTNSMVARRMAATAKAQSAFDALLQTIFAAR